MRYSAAVLVSFYNRSGRLFFILVRRQNGRYKFPGGRFDPRKDHGDTRITALRELKEETGFDHNHYRNTTMDLLYSEESQGSQVDFYHLNLGELSPRQIRTLRRHLSPADDVDVLTIIPADTIHLDGQFIMEGDEAIGVLDSNIHCMRFVISQHQAAPEQESSQSFSI